MLQELNFDGLTITLSVLYTIILVVSDKMYFQIRIWLNSQIPRQNRSFRVCLRKTRFIKIIPISVTIRGRKGVGACGPYVDTNFCPAFRLGRTWHPKLVQAFRQHSIYIYMYSHPADTGIRDDRAMPLPHFSLCRRLKHFQRRPKSAGRPVDVGERPRGVDATGWGRGTRA